MENIQTDKAAALIKVLINNSSPSNYNRRCTSLCEESLSVVFENTVERPLSIILLLYCLCLSALQKRKESGSAELAALKTQIDNMTAQLVTAEEAIQKKDEECAGLQQQLQESQRQVEKIPIMSTQVLVPQTHSISYRTYTLYNLQSIHTYTPSIAMYLHLTGTVYYTL